MVDGILAVIFRCLKYFSANVPPAFTELSQIRRALIELLSLFLVMQARDYGTGFMSPET